MLVLIISQLLLLCLALCPLCTQTLYIIICLTYERNNRQKSKKKNFEISQEHNVGLRYYTDPKTKLCVCVCLCLSELFFVVVAVLCHCCCFLFIFLYRIKYSQIGISQRTSYTSKQFRWGVESKATEKREGERRWLTFIVHEHEYNTPKHIPYRMQCIVFFYKSIVWLQFITFVRFSFCSSSFLIHNFATCSLCGMQCTRSLSISFSMRVV